MATKKKTATAKTAKLEQYGPRTCPLIRSAHMTDAQWAAAKTEFDVVTRRMGKRTPWAPKPAQRCPECGTDQGPFGAASGMCFPCSDEAVEDMLKSIR